MSQLKLSVLIESSATGKGFEVTKAKIRDLGTEAKGATPQIHGAGQAVEKFGNHTKVASGHSQSFTSSLRMMGQSMAAMAVITAAFAPAIAIKEAIGEGIKFNAQMETSRLGMAALIGSFGEVRDASGRAIKDLNVNLQLATVMQDKLKVAALQTTAEYGDMIQALQIGLGPALKAGFNIDQVVEFTKMVTQAASAIGLPMHQLGQEIRALFAGDIGPDSRLANLLFTDIPRMKIKGYVEELQKSGKFYDEMTRRMAAFAEAGERSGDTMAGAWSNLKDAFTQAMGEGTQGQVGTLTRLMKGLTAEIVTFDSKGRAVFNQDFVDGAELIAKGFVSMASAIVTATKELGTFIDFFGALIDTWKQAYREQAAADDDFAGRFIPGVADMRRLKAAWNVNDNLETNIAARLRQRQITQGNRANRANPDYLLEELAQSGTAMGAAAYGEAAAARGLTLTGAGASAAEAAAQAAAQAAAAQKALDIQKQIARERASEYTAIDKINAATIKSVETMQLRLNVIRATTDEEKARAQYALKVKEIEQREQDAVDQVANQQYTTQIDRLQAIAMVRMGFFSDYAEAETELQVALGNSEKKRHEDNVTYINDWLAKQRAAGQQWIEDADKNLQEVLDRQRKPFEDFWHGVGDGMKRAMASALDKGGLRGMFDAFFNSVFQGVGENFSKMIDGWMQTLADAAAGQEQARDANGNPVFNPDGSRKMVARAGGKSAGAQYGMIGLQGAAALYGLYNNPAPKQGQNVLSGAMAGASIGATVGPWGAVIGAVVGAIAGLFAPTEKGKNIQIHGTASGIAILGMDGQWGVDKLRKSINSAIHDTAKKLDAIFLGLPTAVLQYFVNWRPDLDSIDVSGKADGKNWNEELDNFVKKILPGRVIDEYMPSLNKLFGVLGVSAEKVRDLAYELRDLDPDEAVKLITDFVGVFSSMWDAFQYAQLDFAGRRDFVAQQQKKTPIDRMTEIDDRMSVLMRGWGGLDLDEQIARAQELEKLVNERYELEMQYIAQVQAAWDQTIESIDKQIRDITYDQIQDPKQRVEFVLAEQRTLRDQLMQATTPEEIQRITGLMQQNAWELYNLLGKTPEAAKQVTDMLGDVRKIANERFEAIFKQIEEVSNRGNELILDILERLRDVLPETGKRRSAGGGNSGGANDPSDDGDGSNKGPIDKQPWDDATNALQTFTPSVTSGAAAVTAFTQAATTAASAMSSMQIVVQPNVDVTIQVDGDASLVGRITAKATADATQTTIRTLQRQQQRAVVTGRRAS